MVLLTSVGSSTVDRSTVFVTDITCEDDIAQFYFTTRSNFYFNFYTSISIEPINTITLESFPEN